MWVNSSIFSIALKISPRESSEDATRKTQRTGPKRQIFQNFRVQNLVCTQKAHNLRTNAKWTICFAEIRPIYVESDERQGKISSTPSKMCHQCESQI